MFYSIHSEADVDYLIAEIVYAQSWKARNENLTKDPYVNVSGTTSQSYQSINVDLELTQDSVDTEFSDSEEEIQTLDLGECEIMDEIDLRKLEQIPHAMVKEGQILEGFMLEEEIKFQGMDKCIVELPDKQELEGCVSPEISVTIACEQEEFIEEEV